MSYISIPITASGGTVDNYLGFSTYANVLFFTASPVTLTTSLALTPSVDQAGASFNVRWNADVTLSTFAVTICGFTISQDQVNQKGNFSCYYDGASWTVFYNADGSDQPQIAQGVAVVTVPVSGTLTLEAGVDRAYQRLVGSPTTLSGNYVVTASTSGIKEGSQFQIEIGGSVTIGSNTMTVFGISLTAAQALSGGILILATFDGSVWRGVATSKPITGADLGAQAALTLLGNATNASASPTAISFATDGAVMQRSGSSLIASLLTAANFSTELKGVTLASTNVSSAQILSSFSSPVKILDAPAAGVIYYPLAVIVDATYGSATYAANLDVEVNIFGATSALCEQDGLLGFASSAVTVIPVNALGSYSSQLAKGTGAVMQLRTKTGNPTTGDSTMVVHVLYVSI